MAHAKKEDLQDITQLLAELRTIENLKEKSLGCFYLKGKGTLHFHTKGERRYAHVWTGQTWVEVDIDKKISVKAQKIIFTQIQKILAKY
jgi:hypothetical protein